VKTLVNYPDVVKMMSGDLDWTSALGEAVVADQGAVLEAIQAFRRRAQAAGNLKSNDKQVVTGREDGDRDRSGQSGSDLRAAVQPDDGRRRGLARHGATTPRRTPSTTIRIRRAPRSPRGLIWGAAIGAAWGGGHWNTNWGGGDININRNTNINTGNINRGGASQLPARGGGAGNTAWKPNKQPGQVSGATGRANTGARVGDARAGSGGGFSGAGAAGGARPTSAQGGGLGGGAGAQSPVDAAFGRNGRRRRRCESRGSVSASPRDNFGGSSGSRGGSPSGSGLGGYGSGRQTSMDSNRGASSRGSMSSGSRPSGGASRPSGGGGGRGGGGGGRGGGGRR
jgi:hypothetical protein